VNITPSVPAVATPNEDELSAVSSYWPGGVLIVGGMLIVAARFHEYTFRPLAKAPRQERWMYWSSSLVGSALAIAAMIPYGWTPLLVIGFVALYTTVLYGPGGPWRRRRWEWPRDN
jgi:hypothetical protein